MTKASLRVRQLAILIACAAASPTPAVESPGAVADVTRALQELAAADPDVRDSARERLMGLSADDLPDLRDAARQCAPLPPQTSITLRRIVLHVLTRQAVQRLPTQHKGLIGVRWGERNDPFASADEPDPIGGGLIELCLPGFPAYRYLQSGDRVIGVVQSGNAQPVADNTALVQLMSESAPGDVVTLQVMRAGRAINIRLTLDARPDFGPRVDSRAEQSLLNGVLFDAANTAAAYFDKEFAGFVSGDA